MTIGSEFAGTKNSMAAKTFVKAKTTSKRLDIRHISGEQWDREIASFDGACQEQLHVFAKHRWPQVNAEPVLFFDGGKLVGGALVLVQPLPLKLGSIAVIKWGPVLKDHGDEQREKIYAACVEALLLEYDKKRRMMVSIMARAALGEVNYEFEFLRSRGFKTGAEMKFPDRYFVNLRLDDEQLTASFARKWRYHLRRSMNNGLQFERAGAERLHEFSSLYDQMSERKKFSDHSAYNDTIEALMAIENEVLRPELFFVRQGDEIVAGVLVFTAGETAVGLYGATSSRALDSRAGYFINWHIIRWLRDNTKAKYYDLGGSDGFHGLHLFKKGMVGDKGIISPIPAAANFASKMVPMALGHLAFFVRDALLQIRYEIKGARTDLAKPDQRRSPD